MVEKTNNVIAISAIIIALLSAGIYIPDKIPKDNYYCDYRLELGFVECPDGFDKYGDINGKCLNADNTGKNLICKTGWKLVSDDRQVYDEEDKGLIIPISSWDSDMNRIICTKEGCVGTG